MDLFNFKHTKEYRKTGMTTWPSSWDQRIVVECMNNPIDDVKCRPFVSGDVYEGVQLAEAAWDDVLCGILDLRANIRIESAWLLRGIGHIRANVTASSSRGNFLRTHYCERPRGMTDILMPLLSFYDM